MAALGFDYDGQPREEVGACNLCGETRAVVLSHADRYGFAAETRLCARCGLGYLDPRMAAAGYAAFYRDTYRPLVSAFHGRRIDAETVESDQAPYAAAVRALLARHIATRRPATLLDVGGSTGVVAQVLAAAFALEATVLDPSPPELERAAARGLATVAGTLEDWSGEGATFDLVLLCQTVDHLLDLSGSLAKLRSLVAPQGLLFVDIVDFRATVLRAWSIEAATKIDHPYYLTIPVAHAALARAGFSPLLVDHATDGLHVGFVCAPTVPRPGALPDEAARDRFLDETRYVQCTPRP